MTLTEARTVMETWQKSNDDATLGAALRVMFENGFVLYEERRVVIWHDGYQRFKALGRLHAEEGRKFEIP